MNSNEEEVEASVLAGVEESVLASVTAGSIGQAEPPAPPTNLPAPPPPGPALVESKGGLREISAAGVNYVNLMLGNMYWLLPNENQLVLQVEGVWTYIAVSPADFQKLTGSTPNEALNAYGAIAGRLAGSYALVDADAVAKNLDQGRTDPVTFMVVNNRQLAAQVTNAQGSTMAVLAPIGAGASSQEKKKSSTTPILLSALAAGAGALIAGPAGALVAGGATYLVTS